MSNRQRALENIIHFGGHFNFTRRKRLNDALANVMIAFPMSPDVGRYRRFHAKRRANFGGNDDPCRLRFKKMNLSTANKRIVHSGLKNLRAIINYNLEFYAHIGSDKKQITTFVPWRSIATLAIGLTGKPMVLALSITGLWLFSMVFILPILRARAERGEHDYSIGETEFSTTFNTIGVLERLLFYPSGDADHLPHHMFPTIP